MAVAIETPGAAGACNPLAVRPDLGELGQYITTRRIAVALLLLL